KKGSLRRQRDFKTDKKNRGNGTSNLIYLTTWIAIAECLNTPRACVLTGTPTITYRQKQRLRTEERRLRKEYGGTALATNPRCLGIDFICVLFFLHADDADFQTRMPAK